jgi:hypothetical protein
MEGYPAFASHHGPPQHAVGNMGTKQANKNLSNGDSMIYITTKYELTSTKMEV